MVRNEVTDSTWRERNTAVAALIVHGVYNPNAADVLQELEEAQTAHAEGRRDIAYRAVAELLSRAAKILTERDKAKAAKDEQSRTIDPLNLGPWTNPFSEHPLFRAVVEQWSVTAEDSGAKQKLTVKTTLKRSTDHPFVLGADWSAALPADELILDAGNRLGLPRLARAASHPRSTLRTWRWKYWASTPQRITPPRASRR